MKNWLERIWRLTGGLIVVFLMLQPAFAQAASPLIYQLQTEGTAKVNTATAATQEFISIYNNSDQPVDVTNWCVVYTTLNDAKTNIEGCLTPPDVDTHLMLEAHTSFRLASDEFVVAHPAFEPDIIFGSGISVASGHIRLLNQAKTEIDRLGYGSAVHPESSVAPAHATGASGKILQRILAPNSLVVLQDSNNNSLDFAQVPLGILPSSGLYEEVIPVDVCANIDGLQTSLPAGYLLDENGDCRRDLCANIDGLQLAVPAGYESLDGENCTLIPLENATLLITELLANAPSSDAGKEFIELYNPGSRTISLKGYTLQLGPSYAKSYTLPTDKTIAPHAYLALSDTQTGVVLPNSSASVRLTTPAGNVVSTTDVYNQPKDDEAWATVNDIWQFTNRPTPGRANVSSLISSTDEDEPADTANLTPCAAGKERNPATNRCRTIQAAVAGLTACKPGQTRNPETNRCRSVLSAGTSLTPCKAGQERNPATNRCRAAASANSDLKPCASGQERNPETNRCRKSTSSNGQVDGISKVKDVDSGSLANNPRWMVAGLGVAGALGYAGYEWRREVSGFFSRFKKG